MEWHLRLKGRCTKYMGYPWHFSAPGILGSFGALVSKWRVAQQRLPYSKTEWNLGLRGICTMYMGYFWPFSVQGHVRIWVIHSTFLKIACKSKMIGQRPKRSEIWSSSGIVVLWMCGVPLIVYHLVSLGSWGALVSKWPASWKHRGVE